MLVGLSFIDSLPVLFYLKSAAEAYFNGQNEPQQEKPTEELRKEQEGRGTDDDSDPGLQHHKEVHQQ